MSPGYGLLFWWVVSDVVCNVNSMTWQTPHSFRPGQRQNRFPALLFAVNARIQTEMVPQRCLSRLKVVGVTPDGSWLPLGSPTASPGSEVRTSPRLRTNVPQPFSSIQKPLWRRNRPPGMEISHVCALTQISLRGSWLLFLLNLKMVANDLRIKVAGSCRRCSGVLVFSRTCSRAWLGSDGLLFLFNCIVRSVYGHELRYLFLISEVI